MYLKTWSIKNKKKVNKGKCSFQFLYFQFKDSYRGTTLKQNNLQQPKYFVIKVGEVLNAKLKIDLFIYCEF